MSKIRNLHLLLLALTSGLLLGLAWFPAGIFPLAFIAFVPLLIAEHAVYLDPDKFKAYALFTASYLCFLTWNLLVTWWVKNASIDGAAMAFLANSLLMTIVFMLYHWCKKQIGVVWSTVLFVCFWIGFEYLHLDWDLTWPWLTLGNLFAGAPRIVQWYDLTGVFGGSLWILFVNALVFELVLSWKNKTKRSRWKAASIIFLFLLIPIVRSLQKYDSYEEPAGKKAEVVLVQPNIDPNSEKFSDDFRLQLAKMLSLAKQKLTPNTDYILFPETALTEDIWENQLESAESIHMLRDFLKTYPKLRIIIGASTFYPYGPLDDISPTARQFTQADGFYDAFNTALQIDTGRVIQIYHKSKLVPGVEKMPFPGFFKYFEDFAISLGGISGSLGMQEERTVFTSVNGSTAPVVCYESIYGEYVGEYVRNGAQFISIITNDGWWGDTPGYKQHLKFGALRAIETRKWIARSANTGISCFIDPKGNVLQPAGWWVPAVISGEITLHDGETFYTRHGDYIAKAALCIAFALLIYSILVRFRIAKKW